jgi:poly(3-hydroxybutyrate) depolymerase
MRLVSLLAAAVMATAPAFAADAPPAPAPAPELPRLGVQAEGATVSGVSSGAYMAVQLHLSQGPLFAQGVAAVAGGPFGCAQGSMLQALGPCLGRSPIDVPLLVQRTQELVAQGDIPPLSAQQNARAYLFSGAKDTVVNVATTQALQAQLQALLPQAQIALRTDVPAAHGWVAEREGSDCDRMAAPHILKCGFDLAGALLQHLLGPMNTRADAVPEGALRAFDQRPFHAGPDLGPQGFVFVPKACEAGGCRVHVALHGCQMNAGFVGDAFARRNGLNEWAATNRLVVLYPQTGSGAVNGCWDWWGYGGTGYLGRNAPQMKAIAGMVARLQERVGG